MKLSSTDVYRELQRHVGPTAAGLGFSGPGSSKRSWSARHSDQYVTFWFQCDKWGWRDEWGSRFTMEYQLSKDRAIGSGSYGSRRRFFTLLEPEQREQIRHKNSKVIAALPGTRRGLVQTHSLGGDSQIVVGYVKQPSPHQPDDDVWLHYHSLKDAAFWGKFLAGQLQDMLNRFLKEMGSVGPGELW